MTAWLQTGRLPTMYKSWVGLEAGRQRGRGVVAEARHAGVGWFRMGPCKAGFLGVGWRGTGRGARGRAMASG